MPPRATPWRALHARPFRIWSAAQAVSNVGTWMQLVAQTLLVLTLSHSVALAGVATAVQLAPMLLLGPTAGALVDRWPKRRTVVASQAVLGMLALVVAGVAARETLTTPTLLVLCALSGVVAALDAPAVALFGSELVEPDDVPSALAVGSLVSNAGRLGGTALAAAVLAVLSPAAAYALNGLSFLLVAGVAAWVPTVGAAPAPAPVDVRTSAGIRHALGDPQLAWLFTIACTAGALSGQYQLTAGALVLGPLHGGPGALGAVGVALAIGAVSGAVWAGRWERPGMRAVTGAVALGAGMQTLAGLAPGLGVLLVLLAVAGFAQSAAAVAAMTMVAARPPHGLRGRVVAAWGSATGLCGILCPLVLGSALSALGPRGGLVVTGLLAGGLALAARPLSVRLFAPRCDHLAAQQPAEEKQSPVWATMRSTSKDATSRSCSACTA